MPLKIVTYLRHHAIASLALICSLLALAGSSYAAITISGTQLRNHSVDAVKLNPRSIAGSIKAWANVQYFNGHLAAVSSNGPVRVFATTNGEEVTWTRQRFSQKCIASATPQVNLVPGHGGGFVIAQPPPMGRAGFNTLLLFGSSPNGSGQPQPAFVMIVCP